MEGVVSVKDFQAKGDGMADDRVAIQNAINQLYSYPTGSVARPISVYFPPGTYRISGPIYMNGGGG